MPQWDRWEDEAIGWTYDGPRQRIRFDQQRNRIFVCMGDGRSVGDGYKISENFRKIFFFLIFSLLDNNDDAAAASVPGPSVQQQMEEEMLKDKKMMMINND